MPSVPAYGRQFPLSAFPDRAIVRTLLIQQVQAANLSVTLTLIEANTDNVDFWFDAPPTLQDDAKLGTVVINHRGSLAVVKQAAYAAVDAKTDAIIARGFTFASLVFSTTLDAQSRMLGMDALRHDPLMVYPITFNSMDDNGAVSLTDADMVHAFVLTGIGYYRAAIDSGSALKAQIRAATDADAVSAVVDHRT